MSFHILKVRTVMGTGRKLPVVRALASQETWVDDRRLCCEVSAYPQNFDPSDTQQNSSALCLLRWYGKYGYDLLTM